MSICLIQGREDRYKLSICLIQDRGDRYKLTICIIQGREDRYKLSICIIQGREDCYKLRGERILAWVYLYILPLFGGKSLFFPYKLFINSFRFFRLSKHTDRILLC